MTDAANYVVSIRQPARGQAPVDPSNQGQTHVQVAMSALA